MSNHANRKKVANRVPLRGDEDSKLRDFVAQWLNRKGVDYGNGALGAYNDLAYGGCVSGIVSELIYTRDCEEFAKKYLVEILAALDEQREEFGRAPTPVLGASIDATWLAWIAFEWTALKIAGEMGWQE